MSPWKQCQKNQACRNMLAMCPGLLMNDGTACCCLLKGPEEIIPLVQEKITNLEKKQFPSLTKLHTTVAVLKCMDAMMEETLRQMQNTYSVLQWRY